MFKKDVKKMCEYCAYGVLIDSGKNILCEKKGVVTLDYHCIKYNYNPTKRKPIISANLPQFENDDFSI